MRFLLLWLLACTPDLGSPAPIAYDHVACDHCGMIISEPLFAAQMMTRDGDRFEFDDPSCAFAYVAEHGPSISHLWFHDSTTTDEVWLDWQQVAFVEAQGTPMDGGLGAVPVGTEEALSFSMASSRLLVRP